MNIGQLVAVLATGVGLVACVHAFWTLHHQAKPPSQDAPADSLSARIAQRVQAQAQDARRMAVIGLTLACLGLALQWSGPTRPVSIRPDGISQTPPSCVPASLGTAACGGESAEPVREAPNPPLTMALALLGGAGIAIVAGALLIGWGRGWPAKWAGVALVASGFTANGIVFKDAKFGDLFRFDTRIDKVALELEIDRKLKALSEFGPEQLGVVDDFESGRADVRPHMGETIRAVCDKWRAHGDRGQHGLLLVIGSTDRVRLSPTSATQYESNVGLARARAEQVKARLLDCSIPTGQMVTMVSGPRYTPASGEVVPSDAAKDRSVVVWALWSVPQR
ncbi:OmpA family protein [Ralstonia nicotianae]|uniref:OmpA family protein n=1 Tax=Ralstonia pseudosolanacearum TaxID=1310165 RepID=UPI0007C950B5|nr:MULTISPECIES: OmpA family protein [Ralstonia]AXW41407.1 hypothetical protein CJO89_25070 [Ralstonia solanacearum]AXW74203.1 hypothetical protein CJO96_24385 [Ralstonia solanacearum]MDO3516317.1 OmpA family protein [Ralstonia pseudosolanacearum]MDO3540755.1 OmpA family protein [Ralstonia pseudosolanacearum]OAI59547.1 lipoprotein [Ralstonia pseudosolanacearum]